MYIAGLDVGTTGCKIAVFNTEGKLLDSYYREYDAKRVDGSHEINFADVKEGVIQVLKEAAHAYKIEALGVTSFGETFAVLDENDNILLPSMLYTDPRGEEFCRYLSDKVGYEKLVDITGCKPNQMYSIYKLMWIKNNRSDVFAKIKRVLLGQDFIVYTLSGNPIIDYSLAARTAAFDIVEKQWCDDIFDAAGIDKSLFATPVESGTVAGNLLDSIKNEIGIDYDIKIVCAFHDQVAAMVGSGIFDSSIAMDGTGTVECIPVMFNEKPTDMKLYDGGYAVVPYIDGKYACYCVSYTGGATLKWFRDNFAELESQECAKNGTNVYAYLDSKVKDGPTGILIMPHFAGAATPYMDLGSKAAFIGVTLGTTKYDIYKALMEGTSYEIKMNFAVIEQFIDEVKELRATGGGASSDVWLQIKADILNKELMSLDCKEVGAAGTAIITAKAIGLFNDIKAAAAKMAPIKKVFKPNPENYERYKVLCDKYGEVYNSVRKLI